MTIKNIICSALIFSLIITSSSAKANTSTLYIQNNTYQDAKFLVYDANITPNSKLITPSSISAPKQSMTAWQPAINEINEINKIYIKIWDAKNIITQALTITNIPDISNINSGFNLNSGCVIEINSFPSLTNILSTQEKNDIGVYCSKDIPEEFLN